MAAATTQPEVTVELVVAGDGKSYAKRFQTVTVHYTAYYVRCPDRALRRKASALSHTQPVAFSLLLLPHTSWTRTTTPSSGTPPTSGRARSRFVLALARSCPDGTSGLLRYVVSCVTPGAAADDDDDPALSNLTMRRPVCSFTPLRAIPAYPQTLAEFKRTGQSDRAS